MKGRFGIPRIVRLPFGYKVKVVQKTLKELAVLAGDAVYGLWVVDEMTIYIAKNLPMWKKRETFVHEFKHALNDWEHDLREIGKS